MEKNYIPIMSKGKLNLFDIFKQSLLIPIRNSSFTIFSFLTSLPFFLFSVFFEIILQKLLLETPKHRSETDPEVITLYDETQETPTVNLFLTSIQLFLIYLIPYQLLEFLSIITIVPAASMVYATEKLVSFRDMMTSKTIRFKKGPFITSIYVYLLSTTIFLGLAGFLINCHVMVMGFEYRSYFDILVAIVRGVGFAALFVKFIEWSSGWNMALVISVLEDKFHGIEALKFSAYINQDFSQRGLILMLVFFVWGIVIRLPCIFYGYSDGLGSIMFTCAYTLLICLGNLMKWVVCVVYYFDCKKGQGVLENNVDDDDDAVEAGKDVANNADVDDEEEEGRDVANV